MNVDQRWWIEIKISAQTNVWTQNLINWYTEIPRLLDSDCQPSTSYGGLRTACHKWMIIIAWARVYEPLTSSVSRLINRFRVMSNRVIRMFQYKDFSG